jgi:NTP pyrophosphatase (non-canonical NTP hydrolase)
MEFSDLARRAIAIREQYARREEQNYGRAWTDEEIALGFVGDVGDLMKLVQAMNGVRTIPDTREKLGHELADCLWCVLVLAERYGINLEQTFVQTMNDLEQRLAGQYL